MSEFEPGTQVAHIPDPTTQDINDPCVELGFIVAQAPGNQDSPAWFCRFWWKGDPGNLRTINNSEYVYERNLVKHDSVPQKQVYDIMRSMGYWVRKDNDDRERKTKH